jgi:hypothetical protein
VQYFSQAFDSGKDLDMHLALLHSHKSNVIFEL